MDQPHRDASKREEVLHGEDAQEALRIIAGLRDRGFVAYLAGGCVRDALLGKKPKDFDVATNATPDAVRHVFGKSRTLAFGASFGVIGVLPPVASRVRDSHDDPVQPTEVATFRSDGTYSDGRRPDSVHFGDAEQDALRRDFTINGLFYDPANREIVDFVNGEADLNQGILRTIGDAAARIEEDKLRMLRAVRFATTLGFDVEPETVAAIISHAPGIGTVSGERIGAEMRRVLISPNAAQGLGHLSHFGLAEVVLPELDGIDWQEFKSFVRELEDRRFSSVFTLMLLAIGDPLPALRAITSRWKLSNEENRQTRAAIVNRKTIEDAAQMPWSAVQPTLIDRDIHTIFSVAAATVATKRVDPAGIQLVREAMQWPEEKQNPAPLLTGDDLRELGIPAGPAYRTILQSLRDAQLNGELNSRAEAVHAVQGMDGTAETFK